MRAKKGTSRFDVVKVHVRCETAHVTFMCRVEVHPWTRYADVMDQVRDQVRGELQLVSIKACTPDDTFDAGDFFDIRLDTEFTCEHASV